MSIENGILSFPHFLRPGRCGFLTAPGIGKNYPIKFLIFMRSAMSIENGILSFPHFLRRPAMCNETTYRTYGAETSR